MQSRTDRSVQIHILPEGKIVQASHGETLLGALLRNSVAIHHSCGGFGTCGTCCVRVREGLDSLAHRNEVESEMATDRGFAPEERLSCQTELVANIVIERSAKD